MDSQTARFEALFIMNLVFSTGQQILNWQPRHTATKHFEACISWKKSAKAFVAYLFPDLHRSIHRNLLNTYRIRQIFFAYNWVINRLVVSQICRWFSPIEAEKIVSGIIMKITWQFKLPLAAPSPKADWQSLYQTQLVSWILEKRATP